MYKLIYSSSIVAKGGGVASCCSYIYVCVGRRWTSELMFIYHEERKRRERERNYNKRGVEIKAGWCLGFVYNTHAAFDEN